MDTELRRRFLQMLGFDLAAVELREMGVRRYGAHRCDWPLRGPGAWALTRAWWRDEDPTSAGREPSGRMAR
jgi:hypothetical protein